MIGAGALVLLDLFYGQKIEKGWRDGFHEQFDEWLNILEKRMEGKEGKLLDKIVGEIFKIRKDLTKMRAESLVERLHSQGLEQTEMVCPKCGKELTMRGKVERTVETMIGNEKLKHPYFWCKEYLEGLYPLNETLNLSERKK